MKRERWTWERKKQEEKTQLQNKSCHVYKYMCRREKVYDRTRQNTKIPKWKKFNFQSEELKKQRSSYLDFPTQFNRPQKRIVDIKGKLLKKTFHAMRLNHLTWARSFNTWKKSILSSNGNFIHFYRALNIVCIDTDTLAHRMFERDTMRASYNKINHFVCFILF